MESDGSDGTHATHHNRFPRCDISPVCASTSDATTYTPHDMNRSLAGVFTRSAVLTHTSECCSVTKTWYWIDKREAAKGDSAKICLVRLIMQGKRTPLIPPRALDLRRTRRP